MRLRLLPIVALLSVSVNGFGTAESVEPVKTWNFKLPHGSLRIDVKVSKNGRISMGIGPNHQAPAAPIAEQVKPLQQVLADMAASGLDPRKLSYIGTRLFEEDVLQRLAYACADSTEWQRSMQNRGQNKEKLVVALLNQSGAYEKYNEAFQPYGLRVRVTEAEQLGLMTFSQVPARGSHDRRKAKLPVPADAILGLRFLPISARQNKSGQPESLSEIDSTKYFTQ